MYIPESRGARRNLAVVTTTDGQDLWVSVSGELDLATHDELETALAGLSVNGARTIHMELSGLKFCDVRGVSHLLAFARRMRQAEHPVSLDGAGRTVRRLITLLAAEDENALI